MINGGESVQLNNLSSNETYFRRFVNLSTTNTLEYLFSIFHFFYFPVDFQKAKGYIFVLSIKSWKSFYKQLKWRNKKSPFIHRLFISHMSNSMKLSSQLFNCRIILRFQYVLDSYLFRICISGGGCHVVVALIYFGCYKTS